MIRLEKQNHFRFTFSKRRQFHNFLGPKSKSNNNHTLTDLMNSMLPMASDDSALWTLDQHQTWISLFGSPNPIAYPGVKFRRLASILGLPPILELQVRVDLIDFKQNGCEENYEMLLGTIPDPDSHSSGMNSRSCSILLIMLLMTVFQ